MEKKIILTGGGSAGHVTPNLALLPQLLAEGIEVHYIGTADGIERTQKEAADALGISQSYISRLEKRIIHTLKVQLENE